MIPDLGIGFTNFFFTKRHLDDQQLKPLSRKAFINFVVSVTNPCPEATIDRRIQVVLINCPKKLFYKGKVALE